MLLYYIDLSSTSRTVIVFEIEYKLSLSIYLTKSQLVTVQRMSKA